MLWFGKESSTLVYGVLDELFGFGRQVVLLAGFTGILKYVGKLPTGIFGLDWAKFDVLVLVVVTMLMTLASAVSASHKIRLHAARRFATGWNPTRNHAVMFGVTFALMLVAFLFVDGVMDVVLQ